MPYLPKDDKQWIKNGGAPISPGELNFSLTNTCLEYLESTEKKYKDYNEIVGALECCKLEFYRRAVASYEDFKKEINGDVFK